MKEGKSVPAIDPKSMYFLETVALRNPEVVDNLASYKQEVKNAKRILNKGKRYYEMLADQLYNSIIQQCDEDSSLSDDSDDDVDLMTPRKR